MTVVGAVTAVTAVAVGIDNRSLCTDGCRSDIPAPYLVTAALAGGAFIAGTVWLIARLSAGNTPGKASDSERAARRRYSVDLQLAPAVAHARVRIAF